MTGETKVKTMEQKTNRKGDVKEVVYTARPIGSVIPVQPAHRATHRNPDTGELESLDTIDPAFGCFRCYPTRKD